MSKPDANNSVRPCPRCDGQLSIKHSGHHSFWGCSNYPSCDYLAPLHEQSEFEPQDLPGKICPDCGSVLQLKSGRFGFFVGCSEFPRCHYATDVTPDNSAQTTLPSCPSCQQGQLVERTSKYGKKFYACDQYPACSYAVNDVPVASSCPDCGWPILTERRTASGKRLLCPQKACSYRSTTV